MKLKICASSFDCLSKARSSWGKQFKKILEQDIINENMSQFFFEEFVCESLSFYIQVGISQTQTVK